MAGSFNQFQAMLFFKSGDAEGWSERYFIEADDADGAEAILAGLIPLRAALMLPAFSITAGRLSDVGVTGDAFPVSDVAFPVLGTYASTGAEPVEANTAIIVRMGATPPLRGKLFLRGLADTVVRGRHMLNDVTWATAFGAYADYIIDPTKGFQIYVQDPPVGGTKAYHQIESCLIDGVSARKPGRPFGLPLGRRKKKVLVSAAAASVSTSSGPATGPKPGSLPGAHRSGSGGSSLPKG